MSDSPTNLPFETPLDPEDAENALKWLQGIGGGAATGAATGAVGGPWGALVGGLVGAGVGALQTAQQQQQPQARPPARASVAPSPRGAPVAATTAGPSTFDPDVQFLVELGGAVVSRTESKASPPRRFCERPRTHLRYQNVPALIFAIKEYLEYLDHHNKNPRCLCGAHPLSESWPRSPSVKKR